MAKDQNGCRFLQRKFDEGGAAAIGAVLPEVLEHLIELMMDPFGNYLIQKLLDRCSEDQRLAVRSCRVEGRGRVRRSSAQRTSQVKHGIGAAKNAYVFGGGALRFGVLQRVGVFIPPPAKLQQHMRVVGEAS